MHLKIDPRRKDIIIENLRFISIDSNEAERSNAVIGAVVTAAVATMRQAGMKSAHFRAQNIFYAPDARRDFITDFELYVDAKLFHIIEAKGSTGLAGAKPQIKEQLVKTGCTHGCITDGYVWQFVQVQNGELVLDEIPLTLPPQIDEIFDRIFSALT